MSLLSQFTGGPRILAASGLGRNYRAGSLPESAAIAANAATVFASAVAASATVNALSLSGRGCINWLATQLNAGSTTPYVNRLIIDGVTVIDVNAIVCTFGGGTPTPTTAAVMVGSGGYHSDAQTVFAVSFQPIFFNTSAVVQILNQAGGSTVISVFANYEIHA